MRVSFWVSVCMALLVCGCSKEESYAPLTKSDMKVDVVLTPRGFENQIYTSYLYQIPFITQYHGVDIRELFTKDLFRLSLVSERRGVTIELKMHETELNEEITDRYVYRAGGYVVDATPIWSGSTMPCGSSIKPGIWLFDGQFYPMERKSVRLNEPFRVVR